VIFDAYASVSGVSRSEAIDGVIVTYTSRGETADNHIERRFRCIELTTFIAKYYTK
jgi:predicted RNA-binding protein with PIN domain